MGAIYKEVAGLKAVEVHYRMAQDALNDMASGKVDYALQDPIFALSQHREVGCACWRSRRRSG